MRDYFLMIAAFSALVSLYGIAIVGIGTSIAPLTIAIFLVGLTGASLVGLSTFDVKRGEDFTQTLARFAFAAALLGFASSNFIRWNTIETRIEDYAVALLFIGMPIILFFTPRLKLLNYVLVLCCVFASVDAILNFASYLGFYELQVYSARVDAFGERVRYPGLSGNTHASGLVAFLAIVYLSWISSRVKPRRQAIILAVIVVLLASLVLIDARRYLVSAVVGIALFRSRIALSVPKVFIIAGVAALFIYATFNAEFDDIGNILRANLMINGYYEAIQHTFVGEGIFYRDVVGLEAVYGQLADAGVTESLVLELARAFGMVSTALFLVSVILALQGRRGSTLHGVILTLFTAEMFYGGSLRGLLGSAVFYLCLMACLFTEEPIDQRPITGS